MEPCLGKPLLEGLGYENDPTSQNVVSPTCCLCAQQDEWLRFHTELLDWKTELRAAFWNQAVPLVPVQVTQRMSQAHRRVPGL